MSKKHSAKESVRWRPEETTELVRYLKRHDSIHIPSYNGFWKECKLVKSGARSVQSCKLKYMQISKKTPSCYSRSKREVPYRALGNSLSATATTVGEKTELGMSETKVVDEKIGIDDTATAIKVEDNEDCEVEITAVVPPKKCSWSQPTLNYTVAARVNTKVKERNSESSADLEHDTFEVCTKNGSSMSPLKFENKPVHVPIQTSAKTGSNDQNKQPGGQEEEQNPSIKNEANEAVLCMSSQQVNNYCAMYRQIKLHSSSEIRDVQLMAGNIDGIIEIVHKLLGNRDDLPKEEMLLDIFQPDQQQFGDKANVIRLLIYNIFSSYSQIKLINKFASIGLKLSSVKPSTDVDCTKPSVPCSAVANSPPLENEVKTRDQEKSSTPNPNVASLSASKTLEIDETSNVAILDQVEEDKRIAGSGKDPDMEISNMTTSVENVKEQLVCNTEHLKQNTQV